MNNEILIELNILNVGTSFRVIRYRLIRNLQDNRCKLSRMPLSYLSHYLSSFIIPSRIPTSSLVRNGT